MKVLKEGRPQKGWSKKCKCTGAGNGGGGCGAELLVEQADVFMTQSHCRDETDSFATFKCPQCKVMTDLPDLHKLPFVPPLRYKANNYEPGERQTGKKPCLDCCTVMLNRKPGYIFISAPAGGGHYAKCETCGGTGET